LKKDIEALIRTKACSIYKTYYSDNPDIALIEKKNYKEKIINKICFILKKTLITPKRKIYLDKNYILSATDTFGADSNIFLSKF
jgi:hypothetical protein